MKRSRIVFGNVNLHNLTRRKYTYIILIGLSCIFISYSLYIFVIRYFRLKYVKVVGENVRISVSENFPTNLFLIPTEKIRNEILENNQMVADVTFRKEFPDTLVISVIRKIAVARVYSASGIFTVDRQGWIIDAGKDESVIISAISAENYLPESPERFSDPVIVQAIGLVDGLSSVFGPVNLTIPDKLSYQVKLGKSDILFAQDTNIDNSIATLQTLIARFRMKGIEPTFIDLRFDKPIVRN